MMNDLAIVLVSGGMDSCCLAAEGKIETSLLHLNYQQKQKEKSLSVLRIAAL